MARILNSLYRSRFSPRNSNISYNSYNNRENNALFNIEVYIPLLKILHGFHLLKDIYRKTGKLVVDCHELFVNIWKNLL